MLYMKIAKLTRLKRLEPLTLRELQKYGYSLSKYAKCDDLKLFMRKNSSVKE